MSTFSLASLAGLSVLFVCGQSATCNYFYWDGLLFFPVLAAENECQNGGLLTGFNENSFMFECTEDNYAQVSLYDNTECSGPALVNTTYETGNFECCFACEDVCESYNVEFSYYSSPDGCSDDANETASFVALNEPDYCIYLNGSLTTVSSEPIISITVSINETDGYTQTGYSNQNCTGDVLVSAEFNIGCYVNGSSIYTNITINDDDSTSAPTTTTMNDDTSTTMMIDDTSSTTTVSDDDSDRGSMHVTHRCYIFSGIFLAIYAYVSY